jgi:RND family efflux transporter MFP subunit
MGLFLFMSISGCGDKIEPGTSKTDSVRGIKAKTAMVQAEFRTSLQDAVGTVEARLTSTLSSKIMGTVTEVKVEEGASVTKGQVLVVMTQQQISSDQQQALAGLDEARRGQAAAEAALRVAQANARLAEATYARYQQLVSGESATAQEFDEIKAKKDSAKAAVSQAESMLSAAKQRVASAGARLQGATATERDRIISAPYDAVVMEKMVEPGDLAAPGRALIRLEGKEGHRVVFMLEEAKIHAIHPGQKLPVSFPALSELQAEGTVEAIMPSTDAVTRSVEIKLALASIPGLRSGLFARVLVPGDEKKSIRIFNSAIVTRGQLTGIYKVDADSIARFRLVRTGRVFEDQVEILSGVTDSDRYIVSPGSDVADGLRVEEGA